MEVRQQTQGRGEPGAETHGREAMDELGTSHAGEDRGQRQQGDRDPGGLQARGCGASAFQRGLKNGKEHEHEECEVEGGHGGHRGRPRQARPALERKTPAR